MFAFLPPWLYPKSNSCVAERINQQWCEKYLQAIVSVRKTTHLQFGCSYDLASCIKCSEVMLYFTVNWNINAWIPIFQYGQDMATHLKSASQINLYTSSQCPALKSESTHWPGKITGTYFLPTWNWHRPFLCQKSKNPRPSGAPWDTGAGPEQLLPTAERKGTVTNPPAARSAQTLLPPPWTMGIYHNERQINTDILNLPQESQIPVLFYVYKLYWYLGFWGWFGWWVFFCFFCWVFFLHFTMHSTDLVQYSSNCKCINFHLSFLA